MPSAEYNSTMEKAMGLISSLLDNIIYGVKLAII